MTAQRSPRVFGVWGTLVISIFIFFFMLLPGGLISFHAVNDFLLQIKDAKPLPALTGTLTAVILGVILFLTGGFLLWKVILPPHRSAETL